MECAEVADAILKVGGGLIIATLGMGWMIYIELADIVEELRRR